MVSCCILGCPSRTECKTPNITFFTCNLKNKFKEYTMTRPTLYHKRTMREIYTTRKTIGGHHSSVTLTVSAGDEELMLDLELNKDLVPEDHTLQYQNEGNIVNHKSIKQELDLCHYHGSVRGKSNSWAAVSTCHGVSGVIFDGTKMRHIEPAEGPEIRTNHFLYNRDDLYSIPEYQLGGDSVFQPTHALETKRYKRDTFQEPYNSNKETRYVELLLVADHDVFKSNNGNISSLHAQFIQAANILNSAYTYVNIRIVLVGVIVWNEINEIDIVNNGEGQILNNFGRFREQTLMHRIRHDNAQLITKHSGGGLAYVGGMCNPSFSVATILYVRDMLTFAGTMGHEMGHNLNMNHDEELRAKNITCICPDKQCIESGLGKLRFSSCSLNSLKDWLKSGKDHCLRNKPDRFFSPSCGDGFIHPGEECDCGVVPLTGEVNSCHACCNMTTCKLSRNAACVIGARYSFPVTPPPIFPIPVRMIPGGIIQIQASTSTKVQRFKIDLICGLNPKGSDIALHLSFRFDQKTIVRNHYQISADGASHWGNEERKGGIPISRGEPFEVSLLCNEDVFKIFINGAYFTQFKHRIPYQRITHLEFGKDVAVRSVGFNDAKVSLLTYPIPSGMYPGRAIRVQASTSKEAERFTINLQCGPSSDRKDDIALHLSFRFNQYAVVRNHLQISTDGAKTWGSEEIKRGIPISRGEAFEVLFLCEENAIKILINGAYFTDFKHRMPYKYITHLNFEEEVTVKSVSFKDAAEVTPFTYPIPNGMYPGRAIQVQASTPLKTQRASINLQCGPSNNRTNIAFHFDIRFDKKTVVRNHLQISAGGTKTWGSEETKGGIPISRGEAFEVLFLCEVSAFKVFINGEYFTEFKHRLPYQDITHLNFVEQITVRSASFKDSSEVTPLTYPIPSGMYPGRKIRIQASTQPKTSTFIINLICGTTTNGKWSIAFHMSFRFDQHAVARNHLQSNGKATGWGSEETKGGIPISRGKPFEVILLCKEEAFKVLINGKYFTDFKHRIPYQHITHLKFEKQIIVRSVSFEDDHEEI